MHQQPWWMEIANSRKTYKCAHFLTYRRSCGWVEVTCWKENVEEFGIDLIVVSIMSIRLRLDWEYFVMVCYAPLYVPFALRFLQTLK